MILGGVGLGICSACRAPGAFWYPISVPDLPWPGTWLCDSCQHPDAAATRVQTDIAARRARITCPHGLNGNVYCVRCDRCLCEQCRR